MMVRALVWLYLACLALSQTVPLVGEGSISFSSVISLYQLVDNTLQITFTETSFSQAVTQFELNRIDFLVSQTPLTPAEHSPSSCSGVYDVREIPLNVDGLVLIYSIPGINTLKTGTPPLVLDRDIIVAMYNGTIRQWNDPAILRLNPSLAADIPAANFTPFYIEDSSMSTSFSMALASFSAEWALAAEAAGENGWPYGVSTGITNNDGNGPERMQAAVLATSSIGFVQYSASTSLTNVAQFVNRAGSTLTPTISTLNAAVNDFLPTITNTLNLTNVDPYLHPADELLSIVDGPGASSWPFAHFNFITTRTNSNADCLQGKQVYMFLQWILTSPVVTQLWGQQSRGLIPPEMVSVLTNLINGMTCCQSVAGGGTTKTPIDGVGSDFENLALTKLSYLYATLFPISVNVDDAAETDALNELNLGTKDFALTVDIPQQASNNLHTVPLLGGAVVPIYNMAERYSVALSIAQLDSIFSGTSTSWADIDPSLPDRIITPILYTDPDVASIFMRAASDSILPFISSSEDSTYTLVNSTADSIGLVSLSTELASWGVEAANMINLAGRQVSANLTTLNNAFKNASATDFTVSPINVPDPGSWPLAAYSYITFKLDSGSFCLTLQNLATFIYWLYTDPSSASSAQSSLVAIPPFSTQISSTLKGLQCGNSPILNPRLIIPGAGSTFAAGVYQSWVTAYAFVDDTVEFTYAGVGSGAGVTDITENNVIWAGSDAPLTAAQQSAAPDLQLYPAFAGSVVMAYRVDALGSNAPPLNLTRDVIVDIFLGNINTWNDEAIVALNPLVAHLLPNNPIILVYRSDASGTTNIFTTALNAFSEKWTIPPATLINWPVPGIYGSGSSGVGLTIFSTANSLGYVELSYASANGLGYAILQNKAGYWVTPTQSAVQSAMNDFVDDFTPQLICTIVDGPGAASWPISAYTYLVLHTKTMSDVTTAQKMLEFIEWGLTTDVAAQIAVQLGFVTMPQKFVESIIMPKLREVSVNGQSVLGEQSSHSKNHHLGLALGVALGVGIPLILIVVLFAVYTVHKRRSVEGEDEEDVPVEAEEWDDSTEKANELPTYNDTLGVTLGNGRQELLRFGLAKGIRFPVNAPLIDRFPLTNNSEVDKTYAFFLPKDEERFRISLIPGSGVIHAGESVTIEVKFTLLMTTILERKIKFQVEEAGEQVIPLNISGDVSTRLDPNEIDIVGKPIGQGAFGTVYRGAYRGTAVAVKVLARQGELLKAQTDEFLKEIALMDKLRSPFIVNFIGASYVPGKLCVVTEFMEKGSVAYVLQRVKLEHVLRLKIAYDCAQAMSFLHNNGVMHRDLKPANLLVLSLSSSAEVSVKLADFGTSRTVTQIYGNGRHTNGWGTPGYMAPELLAKGEYSGKVDVYAFAIMLLELYIQKDPFSFLKKVWDLPDIILRGNRPEIPADCPPDYAAIITACWSHLPESRPSFPDLVDQLEPMFRAERARAKENKEKKRMAESTGTFSSPTPPDGAGTSSQMSGQSSQGPYSLNPAMSNSLNANSLSPYTIQLSNVSNGSDEDKRFRGQSLTQKAKDKLLAEGDRVTNLANLSHGDINQDRKDLFESERDKL